MCSERVTYVGAGWHRPSHTGPRHSGSCAAPMTQRDARSFAGGALWSALHCPAAPIPPLPHMLGPSKKAWLKLPALIFILALRIDLILIPMLCAGDPQGMCSVYVAIAHVWGPEMAGYPHMLFIPALDLHSSICCADVQARSTIKSELTLPDDDGIVTSPANVPASLKAHMHPSHNYVIFTVWGMPPSHCCSGAHKGRGCRTGHQGCMKGRDLRGGPRGR